LSCTHLGPSSDTIGYVCLHRVCWPAYSGTLFTCTEPFHETILYMWVPLWVVCLLSRPRTRWWYERHHMWSWLMLLWNAAACVCSCIAELHWTCALACRVACLLPSISTCRSGAVRLTELCHASWVRCTSAQCAFAQAGGSHRAACSFLSLSYHRVCLCLRYLSVTYVWMASHAPHAPHALRASFSGQRRHVAAECQLKFV
jgi:hypothetical protein